MNRIIEMVTKKWHRTATIALFAALTASTMAVSVSGISLDAITSFFGLTCARIFV